MATVYKFFSAATDTDFRNLEARQGNATPTSASSPTSYYESFIDAYLGTGAPGAAKGSSRRLCVTTVPAGMPMPNSTAIKITSLSSDGTNPVQAGLCASQIIWTNSKDSTYTATHTPSIDGGGGSRNGTARPASIVKIAGGQVNGSGWGDGNLGDEHWWHEHIGFDGTNTMQGQDLSVGMEMHGKQPGPAPGYYINSQYRQFRQIIRGGQGGTWTTGNVWSGATSTTQSYRQRVNYWDDNGFVATLYGPDGGGGTPFYSINDSHFPSVSSAWSGRAAALASCTAIPAPSSADPLGGTYPTDYRYADATSGGARGTYTIGTVSYEFIQHVRYSDRETNSVSEVMADGTAPICSVPGFYEAWMRKWTMIGGVSTPGSWVNIVPKWYGATAFSIIDQRSSSSVRICAGHWFIWAIYRGTSTASQIVWLDELWHGDSTCTARDMTADGSDPSLSGPTLGGTSAPTNSAVPVITGNTTQGFALSATTGTWANSPTSFAYQWKSAGSNVGTNTNTYTLLSGDVGHTMTVTVTATNSGGSASATSAATTAVVGPSDNTTIPALAGWKVRYGNTTVGSIRSSLAPADWTTFCAVTVSAPMTIDTLWLWLTDGAQAAALQQVVQLGVYSDNGATGPGNRLCTSATATFTAPVLGDWYQFAVSPGCVIAASGTYWLGCTYSTTPNVATIGYTTSTGNGRYAQAPLADPAAGVLAFDTVFAGAIEGIALASSGARTTTARTVNAAGRTPTGGSGKGSATGGGV